MKLEKIRTLDGLRGFAALLILWAHFPAVEGRAGELFWLFSSYMYAGYVGVDVFFALSGFLITRILLTEKEAGNLSFKRFYLKRSLRIFPIYYLTIIVVGILITWQHMGWVAAYVSNYFFSFDRGIHPMAHTWSLCIEEHFYLFWPLIISLCTRESAKKIISIIIPAVAVTAAVITVFVVDDQLAKDLIYRGTHFRILTLAFGSTVAFYESSIKTLSVRTVRYGLAALAGALIFMNLYSQVEGLQKLPIAVVELLLFAVFSTLLLIIIVRLNYSTVKSAWTYLFTNPVITYCGKISYGIYLYHFPILFFLGITENQLRTSMRIETGLLALALCFLIPAISYAVIEKPLLKIKDKVATT